MGTSSCILNICIAFSSREVKNTAVGESYGLPPDPSTTNSLAEFPRPWRLLDDPGAGADDGERSCGGVCFLVPGQGAGREVLLLVSPVRARMARALRGRRVPQLRPLALADRALRGRGRRVLRTRSRGNAQSRVGAGGQGPHRAPG